MNMGSYAGRKENVYLCRKEGRLMAMREGRNMHSYAGRQEDGNLCRKVGRQEASFYSFAFNLL